ncbi:inosine/xanthosine triphosphatase [Endozoicomonas sp. ONNA2]|uniref:inosine/xanthosine triphosphatase n=1 Tax=Endozoicomonas sp. ONNA2 TaxID=2828741 RepID=UPI002148CF29|nr:inosine/xanthosine triphosphatase [Endozoicomonas sp. ONNA2]
MNLSIPNSKPAIDIVVSSESTIKNNAIKKAFARYHVNVIATKAHSGINSQPVENETLTGAGNRIKDAKAKYQSNGRRADFFVAIENGIFHERVNGQNVWLDRAVVVVETSGGKQYIRTTSPVLLPAECVAIARKRGFDNITVGQVMAEIDSTVQHDDPHSSLPPFKSRQAYLEETLVEMVGTLEREKMIRRV